MLQNPHVQNILLDLRSICAESEAALESYWARQILATGTPDDSPEKVFTRLKTDFPYYYNYEDLTRLELCGILSATNTAPRKIAFLGSGPLPLTSFTLLAALNSTPRLLVGDSITTTGFSEPLEKYDDSYPMILNVDIDQDAIDISRRVGQALGGRGHGMEYMCVDANADTTDLSEFDVVYVAALVGNTQKTKEDTLASVASRMKKGALVVIRSAWGLRTCLYAEVDMTTERIMEKLEPCLVMHPYGGVVNSVIVARVKGE